jgi:hypothetical protein
VFTDKIVQTKTLYVLLNVFFNSLFFRSFQWTLLYITISFILNYNTGYGQEFYRITIFTSLGTLFLVYINLKHLFPLFYLGKKEIKYFIILFIIIFILTWLIHGDIFPWNIKEINTYDIGENNQIINKELNWILRNALPLIVISFGSSLFELTSKNGRKERKLEVSELYPSEIENNNQILKTKDFISVKSNHKIHRIRIDEIIYIESLSEYIVFVLKNEKIISLGSLKETIKKLPSSNFIRVHKSYIVSSKNVINLYGNQLDLGISKIPIGGSYKKEVLSVLFPDLNNLNIPN